MSVETPEPLRLPDGVVPLAVIAGELAEDLKRLADHLPCLDSAAADESAHENVRYVVALQAKACRAALKLFEVES